MAASSPLLGQKDSARSSSGIIYRSKSVADLRRTPGPPLQATLSRSSTPGYLAPRYRSASVATTDAAEKARETDRKRRQAAQRCMSTWEALMDKYGAIGVDEDDEVDILTGRILVNRGRVDRMEMTDWGDILGSPEGGSDDEDDGATEVGEEDPDRDELAGWSDDEPLRIARPPLAPRTWTAEDEADLAAFRRAETERRTLNDEDALDTAPSVSLLFNSREVAPPQRLREGSVAPWKYGTRVYESSEHLHSSSVPPHSDTEEEYESDDERGDWREEDVEGERTEEGETTDEEGQSVSASLSPSHALPPGRYPPAKAAATSRPPRPVKEAFRRSVRPHSPAVTKSPIYTASKAAGPKQATLADLFTPTPSPPPTSRSMDRQTPSAEGAAQPPSLIAVAKGRIGHKTNTSTARPVSKTSHPAWSLQQEAGPSRHASTSTSTIRMIDKSRSKRVEASRLNREGERLPETGTQKLRQARPMDFSPVMANGVARHRSTTRVIKDKGENLLSDRTAPSYRPDRASGRSGKSNIEEYQEVDDFGGSDVEPVNELHGMTTATGGPLRNPASRAASDFFVPASRGATVPASHPTRPAYIANNAEAGPSRGRIAAERASQSRGAPQYARHDDSHSESQEADDLHASPTTPVAAAHRTIARSATPGQVRRSYTRRTPATEPILPPIPAPEDVDPPNDPERYFPRLHRLNPTTVRFCRLCRGADDMARRMRSYYCKGRQNADWCRAAKEAGEIVTPVRDRNKAVKERKRAMTEARESMRPDSESSEVDRGRGKVHGKGTRPSARRVFKSRSEAPCRSFERKEDSSSCEEDSAYSASMLGGSFSRRRATRSLGSDQAVSGFGRDASMRAASIRDAGPSEVEVSPAAPQIPTTARTVKIARGRSVSGRSSQLPPDRDIARTPSRTTTTAAATPSSAHKRKRQLTFVSPVHSAQTEDTEPLMDVSDILSPSPPPRLQDLSMPPSSPPESSPPCAGSHRAMPTPSPSLSVGQRRASPTISPLTSLKPRPYVLPTPPLSNGYRSASLASEAEYALPKSLPRPRLRSILRQSSSTPYLSDYAESSDNGIGSSSKRARFSLAPRSPTHDDVSYDEGDLVYPSDDCNSSPVKSWRGASSSSIGFEPVPCELAVRAADVGVQLTGYTGRLPSHMLRALAPFSSPSTSKSPDPTYSSSAEKLQKGTRKSLSPGSGLMLPPPIPPRLVKTTPTRPSPLTQASTAPAAMRKSRQVTAPTEEVSTPIVFRTATPLYVRASMARSQSRARSRSVSILPAYRAKSESDSESEATSMLRTRRKQRSTLTVEPEFEDLGPDWGMDEDILS